MLQDIACHDDIKCVLFFFLFPYLFLAAVYRVGEKDIMSPCGWSINGEELPTGVLLSPTYPGVYPDTLSCYYRIQGVAGQRIKVTFNDLDLFAGGEQ